MSVPANVLRMAARLGVALCLVMSAVGIVSPAAAGRTPPTRARGRLDLEFQAADVRAVLTQLAELRGLNVVFGRGVGGTVTARLSGVTWEEAMSAVLRAAGLSMVRDGNVLYVLARDDVWP